MNLVDSGGKLLILGAGRGQVGLFRAAQKLGLRTIAVSLPDPRLPGLALADDVLPVDLRNPGAVAEAALQEKPDGVATTCMDTAIPALGAVTEATGLPGLSRAGARLCANKLLMKRALVSGAVPTPRYREVRSVAELEEACDLLQFPVVVKALDLQGSQGVTRADTVAGAREAFAAARSLTREPALLAEEFVEGYEFGAQALVSNGVVRFVMLHDDQLLSVNGTSVPIGHSIPFTGPSDVATTAIKVVRDAIAALGLDDCAVNVDLMATSSGAVHVIELTGRAGANGLPELTSTYLDRDYYEIVARLALGESPSLQFVSTPAAVRMLHQSRHSGRLESIQFDPTYRGEVDVTLFVTPGEVIRPFQNSNDCLGQAVAKGSSLEKCLQTLDNLASTMAVKVSGS